MHQAVLVEAKRFAGKYLPSDLAQVRIADIGSMDVNGSMRPVFAGCGSYVGFDVSAGKGVDVVMHNPEAIPAPDSSFDVVVSANCLEHARRPWRLVAEASRILKPSGLFFLTMPMPNAHPWHGHLIDCWRCYTEGMRGLFDDAALETLELYEAGDSDTIGVARKP